MNHLKTLGLTSTAPAALSATTAAAAPVQHAAHTRPTGLLHVRRERPTNHPDPEKRQRAGAHIEGMAGAAFLLDYHIRQMSYLGVMQKGAKAQLGITIQHVDKLMEALQSQFGFEDSDYFNGLSDELGDAMRLFCSLDENQKQAAARHMAEMAKGNLSYIPVPTPYTE